MADAATRPNRAEETRQERRRKPGQVALHGTNLAVDESKLDRNTYEYRWVNDNSRGRVQMLEGQDWDVAPEQAAISNQGEGTVQARNVGSEDGKPMRAVLMRKRKDWFANDQREKLRSVDELEKAIQRGETDQRNVDPELAGPAGSTYTPNGRNTFERA